MFVFYFRYLVMNAEWLWQSIPVTVKTLNTHELKSKGQHCIWYFIHNEIESKSTYGDQITMSEISTHLAHISELNEDIKDTLKSKRLYREPFIKQILIVILESE